MSSKRLISLLVKYALGISMLVACSVVGAKEYVYTNYSLVQEDNGGRFSHKINITSGTEWRGHRGQKLSFCRPLDKFHCIYSGGTHFAIPKKMISIGEQWEHQNAVFRVIGSENLRMLGKDLNVSVISSKFNDNRTDYFYYSSAKGLLAVKFEWKGDDNAKFYLLEGSLGFPF
jgi:hypothetical protein